MRTIDKIIIHCTATREGQEISVKTIDQWHKQRGFHCIGYHYVIMLDGKVEKGRKETTVGAHCKGHNKTSVGVCYVGGLDTKGNIKDTRTPAQKEALKWLVADICRRYPIKEIRGHRDYSPDLNGNGIIEPHEWVKACPCFDVKAEFSI